MKNNRRKPYESLSTTQLKKRLSRTGLRGQKLADLAREIKAGPQGTEDLSAGGVYVMRWPIRALRKKYGRRIARAVSTFVKRSYIIVDEFWDIAPQLLLDKYLAHRRYGANVVHATQNLGQLAATAGSKELG